LVSYFEVEIFPRANAGMETDHNGALEVFVAIKIAIEFIDFGFGDIFGVVFGFDHHGEVLLFQDEISLALRFVTIFMKLFSRVKNAF